MKKLILLTAILIVSAFAYPQTDISGLAYAPGTFTTLHGEIVTGTGTLMLKSGTWIIRVEGRNTVTDYVPTNLDVNFKTAGLMVHFKGEVEKTPRDVRMIGTPIRILNIERIE